jgi:hypothetical protein
MTKPDDVVDLEKAVDNARKLDAISWRTDLDDVRVIVGSAVVSIFRLAEEVERYAVGVCEVCKHAYVGQKLSAGCAHCELERLRAAGFDVIERIEAWEAAVRKIIGGREVEHGMDLTQLRAALPPEPSEVSDDKD